ncbi:beta-1,3-galactosyltransferase 5-like [Tubulanus polymorphus]|uniref:beta-1,3-galactosyltransferase 5-like n=1 Tax=Tubulanus polymorphus TaxID=672921 RepID=UPI003DA320B1
MSITKDMNEDDLDLIIVVFSAPGNFAKRKLVRETWATYLEQRPYRSKVKLVFLLGKTNKIDITRSISSEITVHRDIIQMDMLDKYTRLTEKSVAFLRWVMTRAKSAKYVMKVDDDVFVNVPNLLRAFNETSRATKRFFLCHRIHNNPVVRDVNSKWYISKREFSADIYPDYCAGNGYTFSNDITEELFSTAKSLPYFPMEDVFVTGIVRLQINANLVGSEQFHSHAVPHPCLWRKIITYAEIPDKTFRSLWTEMHNTSLDCRTRPATKIIDTKKVPESRYSWSLFVIVVLVIITCALALKFVSKLRCLAMMINTLRTLFDRRKHHVFGRNTTSV